MKRISVALARISFCVLTVSGIGFLAQEDDAQSCPASAYKTAAWPQGRTIYYSTAGLDTTTATAVASAITQWNTANQSNGSSVSFAPADANNPAV